jgi:riboflavin synthase
MFSGIVYDTGRIRAVKSSPGGAKIITVSLNRPIMNREKGMSIAVDGACLTAVSFRGAREFSADVSQETLKCTTTGSRKPGDGVNIEFPLTADKFLSGHIVQGHVDCTGKVISLRSAGRGAVLKVGYPEQYSGYLIEKGSVTVSGISLTAYNVGGSSFTVAVIPETLASTTVKNLKTGDEINLEFDLIGKYVEKFIKKGR